MSADEEFEETATHGEGGQEEGAAVAVGAPGGAQGETPSGSPWWEVWCDRIGAGEEGLDATRTNLALQLQAQDHAERLARAARHSIDFSVQFSLNSGIDPYVRGHARACPRSLALYVDLCVSFGCM